MTRDVMLILGVISISMFGARARGEAVTGKEIKEALKGNLKHLEGFYHDMHEYPELSGEEKRTSEKVSAELKAQGYQVTDHIGGYGVAGVLKNGEGPVTLIRAELDALPVPEDSKLPYKSKNAGVMQACGHDLNMTSLLGTSQFLATHKDLWKGTIVVIGQPAEERGQGAEKMIKDGLFKKVPKPEYLLALHVSGMYPSGTVLATPGDALANVDSVDVKFNGRGTHGSAPHKGVDPFVMTAEFILAMQTLVGREVDPIKPAVISVGAVNGGAKHNIIPDDVKIQLTVRTYDDDVRKLLLRRIKEIAEGISKTNNGLPPEVGYPETSPAVHNDPALTARVMNDFKVAVGDARVKEAAPIMGSEDFSYFSRELKVPSVFFWVGTDNGKIKPAPINHSPRYLPEFSPAVETGVTAMTAAVLDLNGKQAESPSNVKH